MAAEQLLTENPSERVDPLTVPYRDLVAAAPPQSPGIGYPLILNIPNGFTV